MRKDGKTLEQIVAIIEKTFAKDGHVTVESPKFLIDRVTKEQREHDVVVTIKHQHHTTVIAIECRDLSRPVTVNQIESFAQKCADTKVDKGVIVSTAGFSKSAREKADHLGIRLLDLEEVEKFDWLLTPGFEVFERTLNHSQWYFQANGEALGDKTLIEVLDADGELVTPAILIENARKVLDAQVPASSITVENAKHTARVETPGFKVRNRVTKAEAPVAFANVEIIYSITAKQAPFKHVQYVDKGDGTHITDAAVAEVKVGNATMKLMMVYKKEEGGALYLMPGGAKK